MFKIKRPIRLICTGILALTFYAIPVGLFIYTTLRINVASTKSIMQWIESFDNGDIIIDDTKSWIVLLLTVFFYPLGLAIWAIAYKSKIFRHVSKNKVNVEVAEDTSSKNLLFKPTKMRLQNLGNRPEMSSVFQKEVTAEERNEADVQDILKFSDSFGVSVFKNLKLKDFTVPVSVATNTKALLIFLVNTPDCHWTVDLNETEATESVWVSGDNQIPSPIKNLLGCTEELREMEPLATIFPVIAISEGEILDINSVLPFLEGKGIRLVRFKNGAPDSLMELKELIISEFSNTQDDEGVDEEEGDDEFVIADEGENDELVINDGEGENEEFVIDDKEGNKNEN